MAQDNYDRIIEDIRNASRRYYLDYYSMVVILYNYFVDKYFYHTINDKEVKILTECYPYPEELKNEICIILDKANYSHEEYVEFFMKLTDNYMMNMLKGGYDSSSKSIRELAIKLLDVKNEEILIDIGSGDGSALSYFNRYLRNKEIIAKFCGVEINQNAVYVSKLYTTLAGLYAELIQGDITENNILPNYDKGFIFPPYGMIMAKNQDELLSVGYGSLFSSRSESSLMMTLKALEKMNDNGRLVVLLPLGSLFRTTSRGARKYLVDNRFIEGIINIPTGVLYGTGVSTAIVVFKKNSNTIKVVDASKYSKENKLTRLVELDTDSILNEYNNGAKIADIERIVENDYNLTPSNYLGVDVKTIKINHPEKISNIAEIIRGSQYTISKFKDVISEKPTNYQILTSSDIQDNSVDYDALNYIEDDSSLDKFALQENDMVVTSKSTKVKLFVARNIPNRKIIVTGGMFIVRTNPEKMNTTYLMNFLDSNTGRQLLASVTKGAVIKTISLGDFVNLRVSCPSLEEQEKLANKYNDLIMVRDSMKAQLKSMQQELDDFFENNAEGSENSGK